MLEERLNHKKPQFRGDLEKLYEKWSDLDREQRKTEITCLFEVLRSLGISKEEFFEEADQLFDKQNHTNIHLWVYQFITYGPAFLKPDFQTKAKKTKADLSASVKPDKTKKIIKPKKKIKPVRHTEKRSKSTTVKKLIRCKKNNFFLKEDAEFIYQNIEKEWGRLSCLERASVLRGLFRLESLTVIDEKAALEKFFKKINFLTKEQLLGYIEIFRRPDTLRYYVSKKFLDDEAITMIGRMRLEFEDLFEIDELVDKLKTAAKKPKKNLTRGGRFKIEKLREIRNEVVKSIQAVRNLTVGETYVINPDSPLAKEYEGYAGDTFQFLNQDDKMLSDYQDLRRGVSQAFFIGRGGRIYIINYKAVCPLCDIQSESDSQSDSESDF